MIKKLIILDLNKTLIYRQHISEKATIARKPDFEFSKYKCYFRSDLKLFLDYIFQNYEVGVWTSAKRSNSIQVIDRIFKDRKLAFIYTRETCTDVKNTDSDFSSFKDVEKVVFKNPKYNVENTLIIEDSDEKYKHAIKKNVMNISPYTGNQEDLEFKKIIDTLEKMNLGDVLEKMTL